MTASVKKSLYYSLYLVLSILLAMALQLVINGVLASLKTGYYFVFFSYLIFSFLLFLLCKDKKWASSRIIFFIIIGPAIALCIFGLIVNQYLFPLKFPIETFLTIIASIAAGIYFQKKKIAAIAVFLTLSGIFLFNISFHGKIAFDRYKRETQVNEDGLVYGAYFLNLKGDSVSAEIFKNKKVVLLNFEFIRCIPCARKKPFFEALYNYYKDSNSVLIASVCYGRYSSFTEWQSYYGKENKDKYHYPVYYDSSYRFTDYLLSKKTLPQEVLITKEGIILPGLASFMIDMGDYYVKQNIDKIDSVLKSYSQ